MPVKGRKPKPEGRAITRHKKQIDWVEVIDAPYDGESPDLPERDRKWPARAVEKWEAWRRMPHCVLWAATDWDFALDSIEVAAQFYETATTALASELRNREKVIGTTVDYRRDLRIRYVDAIADSDEDGGEVPNLADYR